MFGSGPKRKDDKISRSVDTLNQQLKDIPVTGSLDENIDIVKRLFCDVDIVKYRYIQNNRSKPLRFCLVYSDGVVNSEIMNESIVKPLMLSEIDPAQNLDETLIGRVVMINETDHTDQFQKVSEAITYGDTVLFADGMEKAILLNTKGFPTRAIAEPDSEKILSGPKEGFTEALLVNLALVRRKVRTNELKMKFMTLGARTQTNVCVCYIRGIASKKIIEEVFQRISKIDIDGVLDVNYITEFIDDNKSSPFRTAGYTERPDVIAGKLLEGRIAIFLDGTPVVLTVPYLFIENFQSNEDYYLSFFYTSFARMIRMAGFFLTVSFAPFYVGMAGHHHEIMPLPFFISIASERHSVPFPAALEAFVMLFLFDVLRETGVRMPSNVGQALSIVGALVIGQAAVEAKLVASPMIIVVAVTGITSLLVPKLNAPIIYLRVFLLVLSTMFGFYGTVTGLCIILTHILNLKSVGIPQISAFGTPKFQQMKDIYIRAPWWKMITRRDDIAKDQIRMKTKDGEGYG